MQRTSLGQWDPQDGGSGAEMLFSKIATRDRLAQGLLVENSGSVFKDHNYPLLDNFHFRDIVQPN